MTNKRTSEKPPGSFSFQYPPARAGEVDYLQGRFKVMLVNGRGAPDPSHRCRAQVEHEVKARGYDAGGKRVRVTGGFDPETDDLMVILGGAEWGPFTTIRTVGAIYYLDSGDAATDKLVAFIDFGGGIGCTDGAFQLDESTLQLTPRTIQWLIVRAGSALLQRISPRLREGLPGEAMR